MTRNQHWVALFILLLIFLTGVVVFGGAALLAGPSIAGYLCGTVMLVSFAGAVCAGRLMELYA